MMKSIPAILATLLITSACGGADPKPSPVRPTDAEIAQMITGSDDLDQHIQPFTKATGDLIEAGTCTSAELVEIGGWVKSVANFPDDEVYFTYCGGMTVSDRIYLDAGTGQVFTDILDHRPS